MENNNLDFEYSLPTEMTSEMRIRSIPVSTIGAAVVFLLMSQRLEGYIYDDLKYIWYVYNVLVGIFLTVKLNRNGGKNLIQSFLLMFTRNRKAYKPIDNPKEYSQMKVSVKDEETDENYR